MVFRKNVEGSTQAEILALLDSVQPQKYENYLRLTSFIRKVKKRAFFEIKGKLW